VNKGGGDASPGAGVGWPLAPNCGGLASLVLGGVFARFRLPRRQPSHFSLSRQREVTKRKAARASHGATRRALRCSLSAGRHLTRASMRSNKGAFPRLPAALLGAMHGIRKQEQERRKLLACRFWGPCGAAAGGRKSPKGRTHGCVRVFPSTGCAVENRFRPTRTRSAAAGAQPGSPFFWLLFFGDSKKSDSAGAEPDETQPRRTVRREKPNPLDSDIRRNDGHSEVIDRKNPSPPYPPVVAAPPAIPSSQRAS